MLDIRLPNRSTAFTKGDIEAIVLETFVNGTHPFRTVNVVEDCAKFTVQITVTMDRAMAFRLDLTPQLATRVLQQRLRECAPMNLLFFLQIELTDEDEA